MSAPEWTPGPWRCSGGAVKDSNFGGYKSLVHGPEVARVAAAYGGNADDRQTASANGHLIAAAPELYEALALMTAWHDEVRHQMPMIPSPFGIARAAVALAKARGEVAS